MSKLAKTERLRDIIEEIQMIRNEARGNLKVISDNNDWSDSFKLRRLAEIADKAREKLAKIGDKVDEAMPDFAALTAAAEVFDYTDPKLMAAVQMIQTMKSSLPETAYKRMIEDFKNRPAMLSFLADTFEKNDLTVAAIAAKEEAKAASFWAGLPRAISDEVFYASRLSLDDEIDFSGTLMKLDQLDEIGDNLSSGSSDVEAE